VLALLLSVLCAFVLLDCCVGEIVKERENFSQLVRLIGDNKEDKLQLIARLIGEPKKGKLHSTVRLIGETEKDKLHSIARLIGGQPKGPETKRFTLKTQENLKQISEDEH
jgi:hypothetical protein